MVTNNTWFDNEAILKGTVNKCRGTRQACFSGQFFHFFEIKLFCFTVAMSDLVHNVEAIDGIC